MLQLFKRYLDFKNLTRWIIVLRIIQDSTLYFNFNFFGLLNYILRLFFIGQENFLITSGKKALRCNQSWIISYYLISFIVSLVKWINSILNTKRKNDPNPEDNHVKKYLYYLLNLLDSFASWLNLFFLIGNLEEYLFVNFNLWRQTYLNLIQFECDSLIRYKYLNLINDYLYKLQPLLIPIILLNFVLFNRHELPIILGISLFLIREYQKSNLI